MSQHYVKMKINQMRNIMTLVLNTQDIFEAQLSKAKLESRGILCELRTNDAGGMLPHLRIATGIQLFVLEKDFDESVKTLNEQN